MSEHARDRHKQRDAAPFPGFRRPTYTQVPDEFFDLAPQLLERHLKIMLYVMRRTFGFKKSTDRISISQFLEGITTRDGRQLDRGCGLSKKPLLEGLKELESAGLLTVVRSTNRHDGHEVNEYELHLRTEQLPSADGLHDFGGFREQVKYVQVPDELFDVLLPDLNAGELKLLLFIVRQTQGFGRESVALARRELLEGIRAIDGRLLAQGTGIGERQLKEARKRLRTHNVIETEERRSADGRGESTVYRLKVLPFEGEGALFPPRGVRKLYQGEGKLSPKGGVESLPRRGVPSPPRNGEDGTQGNGAESPPDNTHGLQIVEQETQQQERSDSIRSAHPDVVVALLNLGVTRGTAISLRERFPAQTILTQIEMLPYRGPDNPPAMLVRAIQEDWAPPPGYRPDEPQLEPVDLTLNVPREGAAQWRKRKLAEHGVDPEAETAWSEACEWVPRLSGRRCPDWLRGAVLVLRSGKYVDVLVPQVLHKRSAETEYRDAVRDALRTVLGRDVEPSFVTSP